MDYGYSELQFSPAVGMKYQRKGEVLRDAVANDTEAVWEGAWRDKKIIIKRFHNIKKKKYVEEMKSNQSQRLLIRRSSRNDMCLGHSQREHTCG